MEKFIKRILSILKPEAQQKTIPTKTATMNMLIRHGIGRHPALMGMALVIEGSEPVFMHWESYDETKANNICLFEIMEIPEKTLKQMAKTDTDAYDYVYIPEEKGFFRQLELENKVSAFEA